MIASSTVKFKKILLLLLAAICAFLLNPEPRDNISFHYYKFSSANLGDFAHSYTSAWLLRNGKNPYNEDLLPLYQQLNIQTNHLIPKATNPPALILIQLPLSYLTPQNAFYLWSFAKLIFFALSVYILGRLINHQDTLSYLLLSGLLISTPVLMDFYEGQINVLLLILFLLGISLLKQKIPGGNFCLGLMASVKFFTLPLIMFSFLRNGAKGVLEFLAGFFSLYFICFIFFDASIISDYFYSALGQTYDNYALRIINRNLANTFIFIYSALTKASGININTFNLLSKLLLLLFSFGLCTYGFSAFFNRKNINLEKDASVILALCVLFSPIAWEHYFVLFIPLISFAYKSYLNSSAKSLLFIPAFIIFNLSNKILFFYQSSQIKACLYLYVLSGIILITILSVIIHQKRRP